jgi:flavin-dependent dehydrogenase
VAASLERWDVFIAGGGPAGSAAAITAARAGLKVILAERQALPFRKVCGEFLSPRGLELWRDLTTSDPPSSTPRIASARFLSRKRPGPTIPIDPPAWGLSRSHLDGALIAAARDAGARVLLETTVAGHDPIGGGIRIDLKGPEGEERLEAAHLIIATGRPSSAEGRGRWWIGRKGLARDARLDADLEMFLLDDGGYVGVSPLETGLFSVCALTRSGGDEWLSHPGLAGASVEVTRSIARFTLGRQEAPEDGAFRVGDALAVWPPVVGDGITAALASGVRLGRLLAETSSQGAPIRPSSWLRVFERELGGKLRLALALHRALEAAPARAALFSLARAFPRASEWLVGATRTGGATIP